jgi:hypothetical protein
MKNKVKKYEFYTSRCVNDAIEQIFNKQISVQVVVSFMGYDKIKKKHIATNDLSKEDIKEFKKEVERNFNNVPEVLYCVVEILF